MGEKLASGWMPLEAQRVSRGERTARGYTGQHSAASAGIALPSQAWVYMMCSPAHNTATPFSPRPWADSPGFALVLTFSSLCPPCTPPACSQFSPFSSPCPVSILVLKGWHWKIFPCLDAVLSNPKIRNRALTMGPNLGN